MSLLVVGLSHHTAPLEVLERSALTPEAAAALAAELVSTPSVQEAAVLATCNRLEVYAEVCSFHGGIADVGAALQASTGTALRSMSGHLFAHHGDEAVRHLFEVACGMDSMALGESQVLGQVREMLAVAQRDHTISRTLDRLLQRALRVGKRAFAETGLSRTGHSLIGQALGHAADLEIDLTHSTALVVGAGAMSSLAATTLVREGTPRISVANRSPERGRRLAEAVDGRSVPLDDALFLDELAAADVVVTCTGAVGHVLTLDRVAEASQRRAVAAGGRPPVQLIVDLALPRDVAPEVGQLPGVTVIGLAELHDELAGLGVGEDLAAVTAIIDAELAAHAEAQRVDQVAPTVVALRAYADEVVEAELARLRSRLGSEVDERVAVELDRAVHRVVDKLLHRPTVRVKTLSASSADSRYAEALAELFDLRIETSRGASITDLSDVLAVEVVRS